MVMKTNFYDSLDEATAFGIDVSKSMLTLCWFGAGAEHGREIENRRGAIDELAQALVAAGYQGKIVVESTGYYHWVLLVRLSECGLDVRLVNPRSSDCSGRDGLFTRR